MATFKFASAQELNSFISACADSFLAEGSFTQGLGIALTQSFGSPSYMYPTIAKGSSIELPWTIETWGEHRSTNPTRSWDVSFTSSMGSGKATLRVGEGDCAPQITLREFTPSDKFLRLHAGLEESANWWSFDHEAQVILGWRTPVDSTRLGEDGVLNAGGSAYGYENTREEAMRLLKKLARPEPTAFMKARGLSYAA